MGLLKILSLLAFVVCCFSLAYFLYKVLSDKNFRRSYPWWYIIIPIAIIGVFAFTGIFLLNSLQPSSQLPTPSPTPVLIVNLNPSEIEIVTDAPFSMQIDQSYEVKVSLIPRGQKFVSTLTIEKAIAVPSEVLPVGTPGATLQAAFGSGYKVTATATLYPNFDLFKIAPIGPQQQPLGSGQKGNGVVE